MEGYDASSSSVPKLFSQSQREFKKQPPPYQFQRPLSKVLKKPVAPLPLNRPRVYKVDPTNFRDLVQKLTGSMSPQTHRLQTMAPPPLEINPSSSSLRKENSEIMEGVKVEKDSANTESLSFLPSNFSPTYHNWNFFPLISPDTTTSLEYNPVL